MNAGQNENSQDIEKLKEIPKWTRKYAQSRTIPNLISLVIFLCLFAGIAIPSYFGGIAYRAGNSFLFWLCNLVLAAAMVFLLIFCIPGWGGKFIERLSRRFYGREGDVSIPLSETAKKRKRTGYIAGMIFGSCVLGSVFLGGQGYFEIKYMQPISALYVVPFLVFLYFWQRPKVGPVSLLWPILYTIHAILIIAGMPIVFTGRLDSLNMLVPTFVYGFVTYIIGHIYSRYALKRLKDIAHLEANAANGD
jgi:hypothetical protein